MSPNGNAGRVGLVLISMIVGWGAIGGVRYRTLPDPPSNEGPHYHANMAVFLNGERLDLSGPEYMEDLAACKVDPDLVLPRERTHMHDGAQDVVHVHATGVTWGHFFANIGFALGDGLFVTDDGRRFFDGEGGALRFILNGEEVGGVFNRPIETLDRLLITFGEEPLDEVLSQQFSQVLSTASVFNEFHQDGPGCSAGPVEESAGQRFRRAFWF